MNFENETERAWIEGYASGTVAPDELAALEAHLTTSREARARLLRYLRLDAALQRRGAVQGVELARVWGPRADSPVPGKFATRVVRPLAWAAAVALLAGLAFFFLKPEAPRAVLAAVSGEVRVWRAQKTMAGKPGFVLQAGDWLLTGKDGAAEVEFAGESTRLAIGAEAEFGVVSALPDKQLKLTTGTLRARVARQSASHPMLIRTPTAKAEVLGTKFEMSATKVRTQMTVEEGRVLIARLDDPSGVVVEARQSATVTATEPVAVRVPPAAQSLDAGLVAHWRFDEGGGIRAADASAHSRDLTLSAADVWGAGHTGAGLDLHTGRADVGLPDFELPSVATISLWVRLEPSNAPRILPILSIDGLAKGMSGLFLTLRPTLPGARIALDVSGLVMGSEAHSEPGVIRVARWQHLAVTVDSTLGRAAFFVDGREVTQAGGLRHDFQVSGPLLIGRRVKGGPLPFDGQLDDLRIYDRALSAAEIQALAR